MTTPEDILALSAATRHRARMALGELFIGKQPSDVTAADVAAVYREYGLAGRELETFADWTDQRLVTGECAKASSPAVRAFWEQVRTRLREGAAVVG